MGLRPTQGDEKRLLFSDQTRRALEELSSRPKRSGVERLSGLSRVRGGLVVEKTWTRSTWKALALSTFPHRCCGGFI
jgi:hypothetical protein